MSLIGARSLLLVQFLAAGVVCPAWADDEDGEEEEFEFEGEDEEEEEPEKPAKPDVDEKKKQAPAARTAPAPRSAPAGGEETDGPRAAYKDTGSEMGRFFVDKVDTARTRKRTLVQGSVTASTFYNTESGGAVAGTGADTTSSKFSRMFQDLRSQLDARHIFGGKLDFRSDARLRFVGDPLNSTPGAARDFGTKVQSGLLGRNEYELKELWFATTGKKFDVFLGRQYILDLAAVKIDGVRIDYAHSHRLTLFGFAGAHPMKGSRSIGFDYPVGRNAMGELTGRIIPVAGGAGGAFRTGGLYGALGAVAIAPRQGEQLRLFLTSNGYLRSGNALDIYHFAVFDLYGEAALRITNASIGVNYKPSTRLRLTAAAHRVDTETLQITAQRFLEEPDPIVTTLVRNDVHVIRIASDQVRAGVSTALGAARQIELSTSFAVRRRPDIRLRDSDPVQIITAAQSAEVAFQALHRNLLGNRIGVDAARTFGFGDVTFGRNESLSIRGFTSRDFRGGRGEWELSAAYHRSRDDTRQATCQVNDLQACYGTVQVNTTQLGGVLYYRIGANLLAMGTLDVARHKFLSTEDAPITATSAFLRISYRY